MKEVSGLVTIKTGRLLIPDQEKIIVYDTRKKNFEQLYKQATSEFLHITGAYHSKQDWVWMLDGQRVLCYSFTDRKMIIFRENLSNEDTFRHIHEDEFGGIWLMTVTGVFILIIPGVTDWNQLTVTQPGKRNPIGRKAELF